MIYHQTLLFENATGGYRAYTTPTLLTTGSGAILAICEGRNSAPTVMGGDSGDIDLVMRRSLKRFPGMKPWIGDHYRDERHKRLLVVGESHYLPEGSTIHRDPDVWYTRSQNDLTDKEREWISTSGNISGEWSRAHTICREIARELSRTLDERGLPPDDFVFRHIVYCNFFLRPAPSRAVALRLTLANATLR